MRFFARWLLAATALACAAPQARAADPLVIGFDIELTGGLAPNGKAALLAMQIWAEEINAKGGLLGRPVKLLYYDDQSNPATVPGIITKLLDVDHVDLLIGGNGTNMLAPAMPVVMQRKLTFLGLFGLDVNSEFHYPKYFSIIPAGGPTPEGGVLARLLRRRGDAGPEAERPSRWSAPMRSSPGTRSTARGRRRSEPARRSSMTRPIRRPPPTTPRSCARSRQPTPTWCSSAPIRPTPSAWCALPTRSA